MSRDQLLLHLLPPFWNLFRELGRLKGPRGASGPETAGGATPLVGATVRLVEELMPEEKEPASTRQPLELEQAEIGRPRADEEERNESKRVDSFEPTYMYDAMKENWQLKTLLVRSPVQDASFCYWFVLAYCKGRQAQRCGRVFKTLSRHTP